MDNLKNHVIVTLTGASSSGKTYLSQMLSNDKFENLISDTTRTIRNGEINGVNYNFLTPEKFQENLKNDKLLQFNPVQQFMYGVSFDEAQRAFNMDKDALVVVAPAGVPQIANYCHKNNLSHLAIYLDNPKDVLMDRIIDRFEEDLLSKLEYTSICQSNFIQSHKETLKEYLTILPYNLIAKYPQDFKNNLTLFAKVVLNEFTSGYPNKTQQEITHQVIKTYFDRILSMSTSEFDNWVLPAYTGEHKYHLIVTEFNEKTMTDTINYINLMVNSLKHDSLDLSKTHILEFSNHYEQYLTSNNKKISSNVVIIENNKEMPESKKHLKINRIKPI